MKKIKFTCHHCEAKLRVPTHLAGVSAPCPKCGNTITAPTDLENIVEEATSPERKVARTASPTLASAAKVSASVAADARVSGRVITAPEETPLPAPVPDAPEPVPPEAVSLPPAPPAVTAPLPSPEPEARYEEPVGESRASSESLIEEPAVEESSIENPSPVPTPEREPEIAIVEETILLPPPPPEMPAGAEAPEVFLSNIETPVAESPAVPPPGKSETLAQNPQDEAPVVEEPRAVEKTQPIQINPKPSVLPPAREEGATDSGELPRLDVNLAEAAEQGGASLSGSTTGEGPTRLQLPQPGTEAHQFSPSDFIVPSSSTGGASLDELAEPEVDEVPEVPIEESSTPEVPPMEAPEGPSLRLPDENEEVPSDPEVPAPFDPQSLLRDEQEVIPTPKPIPVQVAVPPPAPEEQLHEEEAAADVPNQQEVEWQHQQSTDPTTPIGPMVGAEAMPTEAEDHHDPLSEGSFERMLSRQIEPDESARVAEATDPASAGGLPFEPSPPAGELPEQTLEAAPPVMESGGDIMDRGARETDVLDDIFGSSKKETSAPSKSMVFMLSILGAVAIIAIVLVFFIGKTLGGFSVPIAEDTEGITPPPSMQNETTKPGGAMSGSPKSTQEPSLDGAPTVIDPVASVEDQAARPPRSTTTLPGDTSKPVRIVDSGASKNVEGLTATQAARSIPEPPEEPTESSVSSESAALSFDERIQQIVNGEQPAVGPEGNFSGSPGGADSVAGAINDFSSGLSDGDSPTAMASDLANGLAENLTDGVAGASAAAIAAVEDVAKPLKAANYNPPASFDAPDSTDDSPLGKTHDLLDAFLRAPDWETRVKYIYEGESLRPAIEEYYKKWPMTTYDRFSLQLFQMEQDKELGGPYWVYQVSTSDLDQGFPVIIRVEGGKLKVDWEIFSEFQDQHFVKFQDGAIASPHTFRVVIERVSDYYGTDRDGFENLDDYFVYQVSPPYGDLNEFSDYAFVKNDSELAQQLDKVVGLNDEPLAVIVTLEQKSFPHGVKHLSVTEYITEGWFR